VDRRFVALKIPVLGAVAGVASLVLFAEAASAHSASAAVTRECARSTQATVTINNDFDLAAVVTYTGAASGTASMPANGSAPVSFTMTGPSTLTYSVEWSDGFTQGQRSISVDPLTDCVIPTTTTLPPETTTTVPPDTAAISIPDTTTTVEATTTQPTVLGVELRPEVVPPRLAPAKAPPTAAQLPATGSSDVGPLVAIGLGTIFTGAVLVAVRRVPRSS